MVRMIIMAFQHGISGFYTCGKYAYAVLFPTVSPLHGNHMEFFNSWCCLVTKDFFRLPWFGSSVSLADASGNKTLVLTATTACLTFVWEYRFRVDGLDCLRSAWNFISGFRSVRCCFSIRPGAEVHLGIRYDVTNGYYITIWVWL